MNNQELIDKYLQGKMSPREVEKFKHDLHHDRELYEQYKFTRSVRHEIRDRNEKLRSVKSWGRKSFNSSPLRVVYWAAACMVLVIGFGVLLLHPYSSSTLPHSDFQIMSDKNKSETLQLRDSTIHQISSKDSLLHKLN